MRKHFAALVCGAVIATGAGVLAQGGSIRLVPPPAQGLRFTEPWRAIAGGETKIIGYVVDARRLPVAHVKVQLRSLLSGNVEQVAESDDNGEHQFLVDNPGTYVIEMMVADGSVLAVSNAGSLRRYETLHAFVQLPGRWDYATRSVVPVVNASTFFGMGSLDTMTASTLTMAVDGEIGPADVEPVSPQ
jgi:hypothetical protein